MFDQPIIRVCLVLGSLITATYILRRVRLAKVQIEDTIFWLLFSGILLILAIFPGIAYWAAYLLGFQSPINFVYIVAAGYAVALILMLFSSSSFTAIGFDSGGVASGPITAAFILPLMLGLADGAEGFGVIALVGLMPIIVLQVLGIVYQVQLKSIARKRQKQALRIAYEMEMLSNIDALKKESLRARRKKEKQGETD